MLTCRVRVKTGVTQARSRITDLISAWVEHEATLGKARSGVGRGIYVNQDRVAVEQRATWDSPERRKTSPG